MRIEEVMQRSIAPGSALPDPGETYTVDGVVTYRAGGFRKIFTSLHPSSERSEVILNHGSYEINPLNYNAVDFIKLTCCC